MFDRQNCRASALLALAGALFLLTGTLLHPSDADPRNAPAAFTEYATTGRAAWLTSHLLQLAGVAGMVLAVILLVGLVPGGGGRVWARITVAGGAAGLAVAAVLQAVDGIAVKAMVDRWAGATTGDRLGLFGAALAVREIEIGLDALLALVLGATLVTFGFVLRTTSLALGGSAVGLGAANLVGGVLQGLDGYSAAAMLGSMLGGGLAIGWMFAVGVWSWRRGSRDRTPSPLPA
jgi:hypothetical protein